LKNQISANPEAEQMTKSVIVRRHEMGCPVVTFDRHPIDPRFAVPRQHLGREHGDRRFQLFGNPHDALAEQPVHQHTPEFDVPLSLNRLSAKQNSIVLLLSRLIPPAGPAGLFVEPEHPPNGP